MQDEGIAESSATRNDTAYKIQVRATIATKPLILSDRYGRTTVIGTEWNYLPIDDNAPPGSGVPNKAEDVLTGSYGLYAALALAAKFMHVHEFGAEIRLVAYRRTISFSLVADKTEPPILLQDYIAKLVGFRRERDGEEE